MPSKKMPSSVQKVNKKRLEAESSRLQREGLRTMCIHIPEKLYRAFGVKVAQDRVTRRQVVAAMLDLYVGGGFNLEEKTDSADKK